MYRAGLASLAVLLLSGDYAVARCSVSRFTFSFGRDSAVSMTTDGAACNVRITWVGGTSEVHGIRISSPPRNGSASAGVNSVTYKPRPGFKGEDSFVFTVSGRRGATPGTATVRASASVR